MEEQYLTSPVFNTTGAAREETLNGVKYLVAPVTMIVPGVLNGLMGPHYYPPEPVCNSAEDWNGVPLIVYHSFDDAGNVVSARQPAILKKQGIGAVYNAVGDGKLAGEAWFDELRTAAYDKTLQAEHQMLPRLRAGQPIEMSTGMKVRKRAAGEGAVFNGVDATGQPYSRKYDFVVEHIKPDHLAVLPDKQGACSVRDGCGIHVNQGKEDASVGILRQIADTIKAAVGLGVKKESVNNEASHSEIRSKLSSALNMPPAGSGGSSTMAGGVSTFGDGSRYRYIQDVYDDHCIYEEGDQLYHQPYTVDEKDQVTLNGPPKAVRRVTSYEPITNEEPPTMKLTPEQRSTIITGLVANGCLNCPPTAPWKGKTSSDLAKETDESLTVMDQWNKSLQTTTSQTATVANATPAPAPAAAPVAVPVAKPVTLQEWEASMPAEAVAIWNEVKGHESSVRAQLTSQLTAIANASTPARKQLIEKKLNSNPSLADLRETLALVDDGQTVANGEPAVPHYFGAGMPGAATEPVNNEGDREVLDTPVLDYGRLSQENAKRPARIA